MSILHRRKMARLRNEPATVKKKVTKKKGTKKKTINKKTGG